MNCRHYLIACIATGILGIQSAFVRANDACPISGVSIGMNEQEFTKLRGNARRVVPTRAMQKAKVNHTEASVDSAPPITAAYVELLDSSGKTIVVNVNDVAQISRQIGKAVYVVTYRFIDKKCSVISISVRTDKDLTGKLARDAANCMRSAKAFPPDSFKRVVVTGARASGKVLPGLVSIDKDKGRVVMFTEIKRSKSRRDTVLSTMNLAEYEKVSASDWKGSEEDSLFDNLQRLLK